MMALQQEDTSFGIIVFPVFAGVVTPGNVNCKTSANDMKALETHFAAGENELVGIRKLRDEVNEEPIDQRSASQAQLNAATARANNEFQLALAATDEADSFFQRWTVLTKIAEADDAAGKYADAAKVYEQAVVLKPDMTLYNNLGTDLASGGQVDAAIAAYRRGVELQSSDSADAYLNFGITFYNANRLTEAVAPLRKATELDPQNARAWYLLGVVLVGVAQREKEHTGAALKLVPGTIDAFQKAIQLDPDGHYGRQAQELLSELRHILQGSDINTKPQ